MVKTVKDLKEYLNMLPDDALVYEKLHTKGKRLEAVNPNIEVVNNEDYANFNCTTYYEFPDFVQVPLSTEPALDILNRYYENKA